MHYYLKKKELIFLIKLKIKRKEKKMSFLIEIWKKKIKKMELLMNIDYMFHNFVNKRK